MRLKKNEHKRFFPLTRSGTLYIVCAGLLLSLGLYRGELASAFAGSLLLAYSIVSLLLCLLSCLLWKSVRLRLVQVQNGKFSLTVLQYPKSIVTLLCGARLFITYTRINFHGKQAHFDYSFPISGQESLHSPRFPGHGLYIPDQEILILHDFASFFRFPLYSPAQSCSEPVIIPPIPENHASRGTPFGTTTQTTGLSSFDRSENLYETRTYLPGDDPRKINWKVFAHSGYLSIREGELLPPPTAEFFCIFNTRTPHEPALPALHSFNSLINRVASYLLELCSRSKAVTLVIRGPTGILESIRIEGTDSLYRETVLNTLALLALSPEAPSSQEYLALVPPDASVLFFSLPEPWTEKLPHSQTRYFFGPYPQTPIALSLREQFLSFFFITDTQNETRTLYRPSDFHTLLSRFTAEGLNAHIL